MSEDQTPVPPPWWRVESRRAARDAAREVRREERAGRHAERADRRDARHGKLHDHEPVTADRIADAALRLVDRAGEEGLTVRALAQELGVGTMTLYWYVADKNEVLDLVGDRLLSEVPDPDQDEDWRVTARRASTAVRDTFLRHPRAVSILVDRGAIGPSALRLLELTLGVLRKAGFSDRDAVDGYITLSNFVTGYCSYETSGPNAVGRSGDPNRYTMRNYMAALPADAYPNVAATAELMFTPDRDARFNFGLDCLIAGLETKLRASQAGS
jgi:TetR/AcrR family tetracycline transcriptional repressor